MHPSDPPSRDAQGRKHLRTQGASEAGTCQVQITLTTKISGIPQQQVPNSIQPGSLFQELRLVGQLLFAFLNKFVLRSCGASTYESRLEGVVVVYDATTGNGLMLTKGEPIAGPPMAHTCKSPPEPSPKGRLLIKSSKLHWSNPHNVGGTTPSPKRQLYSIQGFIRSPNSKFGPVFKPSIMGFKKIKHATGDAPTINVHSKSKYGRPFPSVDNGENTDVKCK